MLLIDIILAILVVCFKDWRAGATAATITSALPNKSENFQSSPSNNFSTPLSPAQLHHAFFALV